MSQNEIRKELEPIIKKYGLQAVRESLYTSRNDDYEPILDPKNSKFTVLPYKYKIIWDNYKVQLAAFWKAEEIDFSKDREDFKKLNKNEQHFIKMILAFFAASDGIINFNLEERFIKEVQPMEIKIGYTYQAMMENIHGETYSKGVIELIDDPSEFNMIMNAIKTIPTIKAMKDWTFKWIDSDKPFAYRVVAIACVEGIFFSGAFAAIFWLKKYKNYGKEFMNGLVKSNKFIARDEGLHCKMAWDVYSLLNHKLPKSEVNKIVREAVQISQSFINDSLKVDLIGMNKKLMGDYIEYVADILLCNFGCNKIFNKTNPFDFIKTISIVGKANFHETRPTEYQDAHVNNIKNFEISDDLDF